MERLLCDQRYSKALAIREMRVHMEHAPQHLGSHLGTRFCSQGLGGDAQRAPFAVRPCHDLT